MPRTASFFLLLLALALPAGGALAQAPQLVDRIVAVVNKEVITLSELNDAVASAQRELRRRGTQAPDREVLQRQLLERLILDKAQLQLAREVGIRVDEVQLDRAVQRIAEQNKMTLADFRKVLERDGVPFAAFREDLREQILLSRLREREVDDKIQVSDSEVELFLEESKAGAGARDEFNVAHVLVRLPDQPTPERIEAARARAEKARAEAIASADFGRVAAAYSDAGDAIQGGLLGWRTPDRLPDLFAGALAKMKAGEVSEVLRSSAGFHVLKLLERRSASAGAPIEQTHARHILIRTSEQVSEGEARRRLEGLRERLVSGSADFAQLARANSDDGSAARGGDLDWLYPGDTVPEFERALQALKPGEISEPVRTPFGYHLIQVIERRSAELSPERRRLQARLALRERKAEENFQQWLRQLRDQTYVDLRLEER
jgi:peptidyl-prolyl cis-trans isomerase SurA